MNKEKMKYIYGPVPSWRLGRSLGVDLISGEKACTFDCIYCQLGRTVRHIIKREVFVPTTEIIKELGSMPPLEIDYITLSGTGEPTLAANLGEVIGEIKKRFKNKVAVLTNSSLMHDPQVRKELGLADLVVAKLDAADEETFNKIKELFKPLKVYSVYDAKRPEMKPMDEAETKKRRPEALS